MKPDYTKVASDEAIQKTKQSLEANGFTVRVVEDLAAAKTYVLERIPKGAEVFTATSVTLAEAGITDELNNPASYDPIRAKIDALPPDHVIDRRRLGSAGDYIVGSVHAITEQGEVIIASNSGSQLPGYVYGSNHVIWVVGAQKLVPDLATGLDRLETHTLPLEDERAKKAYGSGSVISKLLIYRKDPPHRVTIVLVKQSVGY